MSTTEPQTVELRSAGRIAVLLALLVGLAGVVVTGGVLADTGGSGQGAGLADTTDPGTAAVEINTTSRTVADTELAPGQTTTVTVYVDTEGELGPSELLEIEDQFSPAFESVELNDSDPGASAGAGPNQETFLSIWSTNNGSYTVSYDVTVPSDAEQGDQFDISGTLSVGGEEQALPSETITVNTDITGVELQPTETTVRPGDDTTFDVVVSGADDGIGSYSLNVSTGDVGVGEITDVSLTESPETDNSQVSADGSTAVIDAEMGDNAHDGASQIVIAEVTVTAGEEGDAELTIGGDETVADPTGSAYELEFQTGATLTVSELDPAFFKVDELAAPTEAGVDSGFDVSANVTNTGEVDGTKEVRLLVDGTVEATQSLTLAAGENKSVTFENVSIGSTGEYELRVETDDDGQSSTVTIEEDVGPPPVSGENPPKDLDEDGLYEDVDGNGEFDIFDIRALFNNLDSDTVQNNQEFFNFDGQDGVDIFDVRALFNMLG